MSNRPYLSLDKPLGAWVWNVSYYVFDPKELLNFCKKNNVTELYYSINRDVTEQSYVKIIQQSFEYGIKACALSGDPIWIEPEKRSAYFEYLDRVNTINNLCGNGPKFSSIHLDVEPHVHSMAKKNGLQNYIPLFVDLIKNARIQADKLGLELEWDIPAWFWKFNDEEHGCKLNETLFRYCDSVGIMAYSDTPQGQINVAMPNIEVAKKLSKRIILGSETMDLDEARRPNGNCAISYYEEGKSYMYKSLEKVRDEIEKIYDNFGFAIHHAHRWIEMQDGMIPGFEEDHK